MRLLRLKGDGEFSPVEYGGEIPPYAILSHTWGADHEEVTLKDLTKGTGKNKVGYRKLTFCAKQATHDGLRFFWVDTCCIDKSSSAELAEAINSMFRWYHTAAKCYVYLSDVSVGSAVGNNTSSQQTWKISFQRSRWFTRGWTLQELVAPTSVEFFSMEGERLGDRDSMVQQIQEITGISIRALQGSPLSRFTVDERMLWSERRETKREEDAAYSLLGIFDIHMPLIYGEGRKKAFLRLRKEINDSSLSLKKDKKKMLLDSLGFDQIDARQATIGNAHARTCEWLLKRSEYLDWLDATKLSKHHGFLWIKGKPGTGKSTLMKFAPAKACEMKDRIIISFFFNARGVDLEKSTMGTYRSLLLQLLSRIPRLTHVFDSLHLSASSIDTNYQWSVESLKMLLEKAIKDLRESSVICFIDALDECEEQQIRDMISFFEQVGEFTVLENIKFWVCFASRHYPHITIHKGLSLILEGQDEHNQDIASYLESKLKIGQSQVAKQIRTELQETASGIFIWVVLVVKILNKEYDGGRMYALRRRLKEIPSDLHELFRDILTRDSDNRSELVLCIQWVLYTKRPLSPAQLYFAVLSGVEPEVLSKWDPAETPMDAIERFILNSSKGLAEITSIYRVVQFIHESVKDFLLKDNGLRNVWPDLGNNLQGQSHERLKHCCLSYLSIDVFTHLDIPENLPRASSRNAAALRRSATAAFPFLEYSVRNVLYHADTAEAEGVSQAQFLQSFPLAHWIKINNLLEECDERRHTENTTFLYVLAEANMANLIRVHPSILSYLDMEKERYGLPLFASLASLATGHKEAIRTFLEAHALSQEPGSRLYELYSQYCRDKGKYEKLSHDFKFSSRRTVLSYIAELGHKAIFAFLLETRKYMPDSKDRCGRTPLSWAARNGHGAVVKLLLDTGKVDINSEDGYGRTPLWWAARNRCEAVVKLLLNTGKADVNLGNQDKLTPLWCAVINDHQVVIKLLLNTGEADVNFKDQHGLTPLWWAARKKLLGVVKLLLDMGKADVNLRDQDGRTLLLWAARDGREVLVKLLLDTANADLDTKDRNGCTPLLWAARNGREAVVKLLLNTGKVNVNSEDQDGRTPLLWAARHGREIAVKLLCDVGRANIDLKDRDGRTALWWAAKRGHKAVVRLLLNTDKADINLKDRDRRTPLLCAAKNGHEAVVKMILDTGKVDVDLEDRYGRTALSCAEISWHGAVVKLLRPRSLNNIHPHLGPSSPTTYY